MASPPALRSATEGHDDPDVPAAVWCVLCGRQDCPGCAASDRPPRIVPTPWEDESAPSWARLMGTARLVTLEGETFFGGLADGSVGSALSFALACELLAVSSLSALWLPVVYVFVPDLVEWVLTDSERRRMAALVAGAAVPGLSLLMVALHALWAGGLELGLRAAGAPGRAAHCLRYALYSCGWDLLTSPLGFVAGWASGGLSGAKKELRAAVRIPRFATEAYLGQARRVTGRPARSALVVAVVVTGSIVIGGAIAAGVALVFLLM